jgi:hypothetical protein
MNNNVLEFYIKMKDMMSGGLAKVAQNINSANKSTKTMSYSVNELRQKLREVERVRTGTVLASEFKKATNEAKSLKQEIQSLGGSKGGGGSSGLFRNLTAIGGVAAAAALTWKIATASIKQYMDFEKNNRTYEVLTGNKAIGQALGGSLNELKQNTILGTAVYPNAQKLLAFGDSADKVIPHLKMLGDVSMGDADRLGRLTYAFGEVESSGRLTGRQLMQFINAGFNPLNEISIKTHKSMEELRNEMRKGGITFGMVEDSLTRATNKGGRFNNMLNEMAETTSGKLANLKGKWASLLIASGEGNVPVVNYLLDTASKLVTVFKHWVEIPLEKKLSDQISKIRGLQLELTSSNTAHQRQVEILRELEQINPNIVKGIKEQSIEYGKLASNIDNVTGSLKAKMFSEAFSKLNSGVLTEYNEAKTTTLTYASNASAIAATLYPDLAQATNLTEDKKINIAKQRLLNTVGEQSRKAGSHLTTDPHGITYDYHYNNSKENKALVDLQNAVLYSKSAAERMRTLQPKIDVINKTMEAYQSQYNKYAGIKSMNAANIQNNGGKTNIADTGSASDVAKGITGGGPRVVNINIGKMVEKIEVHNSSPNENYKDIEKEVQEIFLRVLNSGGTMQ